jgi:thiamine-phosphate pyrophosphorylase
MAAANGSLDRLVDACRNRVAEGLRTLEDVSRFVTNDAAAASTLKRLRHDVRQVIAIAWDEQQLLTARDTQNDVGTSIETASERCRQTPGDLAAAAGARVREGLRSLEEATKTVNPDAARKLESIRYEAYDVAATVCVRLNLSAIRQWRLCVLLAIDECILPWSDMLELAMAGGVDCVQIREKHMTDAALVEHARHVVQQAHARGVSVIVNDRPDIALACGADGVHLGQGDMPIAAARRVLGQGPLIGVSTHSVKEARQAMLDGADSIGIGPVFASHTRPDLNATGTLCVTQTLEVVGNVPHLAIGGIDDSNVADVATAGAKGVAVGAALCGSASPGDVAALLCEAVQSNNAGDRTADTNTSTNKAVARA